MDNELTSDLSGAFTKSCGFPVPTFWLFSYNPTLNPILVFVLALSLTLVRYTDKDL